MSTVLVCWKCGASLAALTLPMRRLEECKSCRAELHVCRMCVNFDPAVAKQCREPIAEEIHEKERANFCDYYQPRPNAYVARDTSGATQAKNALDALFGGGKTPGLNSDAAADSTRAKLDDLFKK